MILKINFRAKFTFIWFRNRSLSRVHKTKKHFGKSRKSNKTRLKNRNLLKFHEYNLNSKNFS